MIKICGINKENKKTLYILVRTVSFTKNLVTGKKDEIWGILYKKFLSYLMVKQKEIISSLKTDDQQ